MLKLIKLEWQKHSLWKYIRNAMITTIVLLGMLILIASDPSTGEITEMTGKSTIQTLTDMFMNMAYFAFTGTMLSSFVVSEYENKLITLMYSYPIKRRKILVAKVISVCVFNFIALWLSKLLAYTVLPLTGFGSVATLQLNSFSVLGDSLLNTAITVCGGCIVLSIGMKKKSSKTTMISAFILMFVILGITQGNVLPYTSISGISGYAIQIIGAFVAVFLSVRGLETEDVV